MKVGEKVIIQAYKHDGKLHLISEDSYVLANNDDFIVCGNDRATITENDGRQYKTNEIALLFFFKNSWFNVICQFKKFGTFYYCNIATPCFLDNNIIKYIDYDLDLRVFPDGGYKVLDKNEYKYHKKKYNYSELLDKIIKEELKKLIDLKQNNQFPFEKNEINVYLELFLKFSKQ